MNKTQASFIALLTLWAGTSQAALIDRGGGLIYDDVLNITWLQDANYAKTSGYVADGKMNWGQATTWVENLVYAGYDDWRLPTLRPVNDTAFNYTFTYDNSTDIGYNNTSPNSELAYMYYVNLGLMGYRNPDGTINPNWGIFGNGTLNGINNSSYGENDVGLVENLQPYVYWSGLEYAPLYNGVWLFNTIAGYQGGEYKLFNYYAWAVRSGDVAATNNPSHIPEPSTLALLLTGLGLVALRTQSKHATRS